VFVGNLQIDTLSLASLRKRGGAARSGFARILENSIVVFRIGITRAIFFRKEMVMFESLSFREKIELHKRLMESCDLQVVISKYLSRLLTEYGVETPRLLTYEMWEEIFLVANEIHFV